jgi:hypothetical protein
MIISDKLREVLNKFNGNKISYSILNPPYLSYYYRYNTESNINYLDITDSGLISYSDVRKIVDGVDPWSDKIRYSCKPGSFINKIFNNVSSVDIENFTNYIKTFSANLENLEFRLVDGDELKKWYLSSNYISLSGNLGGSCMSIYERNEFLNIYRDNPNLVKLLILIDKPGEKIYGRSLIWNLEDGGKFMDTIYTVDETRYQNLFLDWAKNNHILVKEFQRCNSSYGFKNLSTDDIFYKDFYLNLKHWEYEKYPYMDTFKFIDLDKGIISNVPDYLWDRDGNSVALESTGGDKYSDEYIMDEYDKNFIFKSASHKLHYNGKIVSRYNLYNIYGGYYHKYDLDENLKPKAEIFENLVS